MAKILVVDDDSTYCRNIGWFLADQGHQAKTATTPQKGVGVGKRFEPDVVIIDWRLKDELDSLQFLETLRQRNSHLKTVLTTAANISASEQDQARFDHLLEKPFRLTDLLDLL